MNISKVAQNIKYLPKLLSDEGLTKKASLNALAAGLDYGSRLLVGFVITPILVAGLGDFYYGAWQILNRMMGYISPASGRPAQALKWTLANQQSSYDYELKRRYVGSALAVWVLFLPVMMVFGGLLSWYIPYWINTPEPFIWSVRLASGLLVVNLIMTNLGSVPQSVLEGENLGYKRMGLSAFLVILGGGFTWLAINLNGGITGTVIAALFATTLTGIFYLQVVRTYAPWFGIARPSLRATQKFLGLSWWFLGWNLVMNAMMVSDVFVLGVLNSAEAVTSYSLTKYAPETLISIVAIMVFGATPGLGGIIGAGNIEKAARIRSDIMSLSWLILTVLGSAVLIWNRTFIRLWVGPEHYIGSIPSLLIVIVVTQFVLIRNDANIIDLTLNLRRKVIIGALSLTLTLSLAVFLISYYKLGVIGLCLGIIIGRSILSIGYPLLIGRYLRVTLKSQVIGALRPIIVSIFLFGTASILDRFTSMISWSGLSGWIFLLFVGITTCSIVLPLSFYVGLSDKQRNRIISRIQMILTAAT